MVASGSSRLGRRISTESSICIEILIALAQFQVAGSKVYLNAVEIINYIYTKNEARISTGSGDTLLLLPGSFWLVL